MFKTNFIGLAIAFVSASFVVGCNSPTKLTGGGSLISSDGEKASFGFVGNSCGETIKGQFQYNAHDGQVKFHASVDDSYECGDLLFGCSPCEYGEGVVEATYRATNPDFSGSGLAVVCLVDGGEGEGAVDTASVSLYGGPYAGYSNAGVLQGNIKDHGCDEE